MLTAGLEGTTSPGVFSCSDAGYSAWYNNSSTAIRLPPSGSNRVGVYVDRPAGTLSFYRVSPDVGGSSDTLTHIHTFQLTPSQEDLLPGFVLWGYCFLRVSVSVVAGNTCTHTHTHTHYESNTI